MNTPASFDYADGNGNVYSIRGLHLSYKPVSPEESSSGVYSGGEPREIDLTQVQVDSVLLTATKIIRTASGNQPRVKGSAVVTLSAAGKMQCTLSPGSDEMRVMEEMLKGLLE